MKIKIQDGGTMKKIEVKELEKFAREQIKEIDKIMNVLNDSRIDTPFDADPIIDRLDDIYYNLELIADALKLIAKEVV